MPRFIIEEEPKAAPRFQILEEESAAPKYEGRPVVQNPDGSWSHERSITIEADGQHMNIPTMFGGKTYTPDQAVEIMRKNKWIDPDTGKRVQTFKSQEEALGAAQAKEKAQQGEPSTFQKFARGIESVRQGITPDYPAARESLTKFPEESQRIAGVLQPVFGRASEAIAPYLAGARTAFSQLSAVTPKGVNEALEPFMSGAGKLVEYGVETAIPPFLREKYKGSGIERAIKEFAPDIGSLALFHGLSTMMNPRAMPLERMRMARPGEPTMAPEIPSLPEQPQVPPPVAAAPSAAETPVPPRAPAAALPPHPLDDLRFQQPSSFWADLDRPAVAERLAAAEAENVKLRTAVQPDPRDYYRERLANKKLVDRAMPVETGFDERDVAIPVGGARKSGQVSFSTPELADKFIAQVKSNPEFPNPRKADKGFAVEYGAPIDWDKMTDRQKGKQLGYSEKAIKEFEASVAPARDLAAAQTARAEPQPAVEKPPEPKPAAIKPAEEDWAAIRARVAEQVAREREARERAAAAKEAPAEVPTEKKKFPSVPVRAAVGKQEIQAEPPTVKAKAAPKPAAETAEQKLARLTAENEALKKQVAGLPPEMEAPVGEEAPKTKVIRRRPGEKPAEAPAAEKPAAPAEQTLDQMTEQMDPRRSQAMYQMLPDIARLRKNKVAEVKIAEQVKQASRARPSFETQPLTDAEIGAMIKEERQLEAEAPKPLRRVAEAPAPTEGVLQPGKVKTLADMTPEEKAALEKRLGVKGVNLEAFAGIPRPALLRALGQSQLAQSYRAAVQGLGERILERVPNVFRAGRGTPIEFREAKIQVKTDIANLASDIRPLKEALEIAPWGESISAAERQRAYQLMQPGGTASTQPIKVGGQTRWAGPIMPQQVLQERQPFKAPTGQWIDPDFEARITAKTPPHIADAARKLRGMYLDAQQELQKLNAITPETIEAFGKNFGVYFPRMYGEYALRDKSMGQFLPSKPMRAGKSGRLLERGEHVEVDIPDLQKEMRSTARLIGPQSEFQAEFRAAADALRKARVLGKGVEAATHAYYDVITRAGIKPKPVVIGGNSYRISPVMDIESGLERTAALDPLLKAGYKVTGREGNRVSLFRDLTPAERAQLGELRKEPGYVAGQGLIESGKEIATRKLFRKVAENPEWSIDPKQLSLAGPMAGGGGIPVPTPTYTSPLLRRPQSWEQMANDPKKFGDLAGRYVRPDIAAELNEMVRVPEWYTKINDRLNVIWKMGKVLNLPTIGRNIFSSGEMARWGGLSPVSPEGLKSYHQAIMGLTGMDKTPETVALMNEARQLGLYTSSFSQGELGLLAHGYNISKEPNAVVRFLDGTINAIEKTKAPELYGSVDQFYKTALYIHNRLGRNADLGPQVSPLEAARHAKKFAIDYEDVSPFVRSISRLPFGSPFIRFSSKAIPLAIEAAAKHPVRFFSVPAAILGINALSKSPLDANQRLEMAQIQQAGNLRGPRFMVLPGGADKDGRYKFLDLGYQLPYGDVIEALDLLRGGTAAHVSFEPMGGTWGAAAEIAFNKSRFTGRQIWLETDTVTEMATKINDHLGKSLLPSWAPPIPFTGFRGGYSTEQLRKSFADYIPEALRQLPGEAPMSPTDWLGRSRSPAEAIASKVFGFDVKGASLTDIQRTAMVEVNNKLMEVSKQAAKFMAMDIPDSEKQRIMDRLALKYEDIAKEFESKFSVEQPKAKPAQPPPPPAREEAKRFQIQ